MTSSVATIYIPYAPYHRIIAQRAIESAVWQTVDCDVICEPSPFTPATLRNTAQYAQTPFIVFLDADDYLAPDFVENCLQVYEQGYYVYTDWYEGEKHFKPRECAWSDGSHHIVTTLYPTALFKELGGFDESLPGHEDADFYMRSWREGICGVYLNEALVTRPQPGLRSEEFHARADYQFVLASVVERNGGLARIMAGCCGGEGIQTQANPGEKQPGDVLAESLWAGMRSENGHVSGRMYVAGNGMKVWVDPRDIERTPHLWREVRDLRQLAPTREQALKEAGLV